MKQYMLCAILFMPMLAQAASFISLSSEPGDWIGSGQNHELSGEFNPSISKREISLRHDSGFKFQFVAPNNSVLEQGAYLSAERAAFRGPLNPGIAVGARGKGCNTISGEFYIYELDYSQAEPVLALDFTQYCDSRSAKLTGSIRLNSDIQAPYHLPLAVIDSSATHMPEGSSFTVSGAKTLSYTSAIASYSWQQTSGPEVTILNPANVTSDILTPTDIKLGGEQITLTLTVMDMLGQSASAEQVIRLTSKSDPQTYFSMTSEAGDYIGAGRDWFYDTSSSTISASKNHDNGVSLNIRGSETWSADFAAPDDSQLEQGEYDNAERFPFQDPGIAGLSISGDGRGCNRNFGSFEVTKLVWLNDQPEQFKANFKQHCENAGAPLLTGEIAYNAVHESVPQADAGNDIEVYEHQTVNLDGSASQDRLGTLVGYLWSTTTQGVTINNLDESRANFRAPSVPNRMASLTMEVALLVTDDEGYKAIDYVNVTVLANNRPPVTNDDTYELKIGATKLFTPLSNDTDADGELALDTITLTRPPAFGDIIINAQGMIEYQHTGSEAVEDSFSYTVNDNDGATSNPATVTVRVKAQAEPPKSDTINTTESQSGGGAISYELIVLMLSGLARRLPSKRHRHARVKPD